MTLFALAFVRYHAGGGELIQSFIISHGAHHFT